MTNQVKEASMYVLFTYPIVALIAILFGIFYLGLAMNIIISYILPLSLIGIILVLVSFLIGYKLVDSNKKLFSVSLLLSLLVFFFNYQAQQSIGLCVGWLSFLCPAQNVVMLIPNIFGIFIPAFLATAFWIWVGTLIRELRERRN